MAPEDAWQEVARLVVLARGGDEDAYRRLLLSHRAAVTSTFVACGIRCPETARDLAQEVALRAWRRLDTLRDPRSFPAWLRRIAANAARDHLRRLASRPEDGLAAAVELEAPDDPAVRLERVTELRLMLAALAEEDEEVVQLLTARADGTTVAELADRLGITDGAIKMRLSRVRQRLRRRLEELRRGGD
jgi:RNA polymerase sigma-70 factor (ECF subfamily)